MSPHLSGRLTMGALVRMQHKREGNAVEFTVEKDNEFDRVRMLMDRVEKLREKKRAILKDTKKYKPEILEMNLKTIKKEKTRLKQQLIMNMKNNYKHIYGMWPATAHFTDENHRMEAW
mmetsp:Transcript_35095/g.46183  ORF Transcript_35095/g.46183 Transcript_35095/m.46183 type:complete len:118 (-) Transcript_35095:1291-1644(-)|eukprot:CAMPEP_0170463064 /NCGR_PEP_ID=MMETSP0123-20130129/8317_1 /TAXON_ID=182087 /ORGANISM="Favella ehrenbergii, Strain Fehren 1" /LENGTH=117 /DNA_ID=CAMNT_0010728405 /DNA_START=771 /DNA_END=1121 /DNA_ORIENTATION=-